MKTQRISQRFQRRNLNIEQMEDRKLFAADLFMTGIQAEQVQTAQNLNVLSDLFLTFAPSIDLTNGVLRVKGTLQDDVITIEETSPLVISTQLAASPSSVSSAFTSDFNVSFSHLNRFRLPRIKVTIAETDGEVLEQASFARSLVNSILVWSYNGGDTTFNDTSVVSTIYGGPGNDTLRGGSQADRIYGQDGNDFLYGNGGNDYLSGGNGADRIYGHAGNDTLVGGSGHDSLYGHNGNDSLSGGTGNDFLSAGAGNDFLSGQNGNDTLHGGTGNDTIHGGNHNDSLSGQSGNDRLYGGNGNDLMMGGSGGDYLSGSSGADTMYGGTGHDDMYGGTGNDLLVGGHGNDDMFGSSGNDTLKGGSGNDDLYGGSGKDNLYGGSGNDYLSGGSGDDGLYGGSGTDDLRGGSGDDRFLVLKDVPIKFLGITVGHKTADTILDKHSNDAKVNFVNGKGKTFNFSGGRWATIADGHFTPAEIEKVDQSLADLHHQVGNTKLLKKENGNQVTFKRLGAQTAGNFNLGGVNGGGKVTLLDASFDSGDDWLAQVVFHEIGHNWDNENDDWGDWKNISSWKSFFWPWQSKAGYTQSTDGDWWYQTGSTFARNYGKTNPKEDFATYFAKVMMDDNGLSFSGSGVNAQKEAFMDDFFASL